MNPHEDPVHQLLSAIAADWRALQELKARLQKLIATARSRGVSGRTIARVTQIPETSVRRWARPHREPMRGSDE